MGANYALAAIQKQTAIEILRLITELAMMANLKFTSTRQEGYV